MAKSKTNPPADTNAPPPAMPATGVGSRPRVPKPQKFAETRAVYHNGKPVGAVYGPVDFPMDAADAAINAIAGTYTAKVITPPEAMALCKEHCLELIDLTRTPPATTA